MELAVLKIDGTQSGKNVTLDEKVFGITPNDHAIYLDVVQFLANQRHGNAKTKDRSETAYSTKKLGRQKGGGGARHGSRKANIFVGGGRVFGPVPRFYHNKLNKKVKKLARHSALSYKASDNAMTVVENFTFEGPKTKKMIEVLKNLKLNDKKSLFVLENQNNFVSLSARNLKNVKVVNVSQLNTYDIVNASNIVVCEGSLNEINRVLATK